MSNPEVIKEWPGLKVLKAPDHKRFRHGDVIGIPYETRNHGVLYHTYKLGSIYGYAVEHGDDVDEAVARNKKNGHRAFWANAECVVISNPPQAQKVCWGFEIGDTIKAFGKNFIIKKAPNDNIELAIIEF